LYCLAILDILHACPHSQRILDFEAVESFVELAEVYEHVTVAITFPTTAKRRIAQDREVWT